MTKKRPQLGRAEAVKARGFLGTKLSKPGACSYKRPDAARLGGLGVLPVEHADTQLSLHEFVSAELARKMQAETARLDQRLRQLSLGAGAHNVKDTSHARRPYPQVCPKSRNPAEPSETWAGLGKKPRRLAAQLKSGKQIDDFRIDLATAQAAE
jgi:DNA-binding protein H-NS